MEQNLYINTTNNEDGEEILASLLLTSLRRVDKLVRNVDERINYDQSEEQMVVYA